MGFGDEIPGGGCKGAEPPCASRPASPSLNAAYAALERLRIPASLPENELGQAVAQALDAARIPFTREARVGVRLRADFLLEGGIAIEIKASMPRAGALKAQIKRYAACPEVTALLVALPRAVPLPEEIEGKKVRVLPLRRLWGVAVR